MPDVFNYARSQIFGMQFEPFTYVTPSVTYVWNPNAVIKRLCLLFLLVKLVALSRFFFNRFVQVTP